MIQREVTVDMEVQENDKLESFLTIEEARELKIQTERSIQELLKNYESITGASIEGISISTLYRLDGKTIISDVKLDVRI